MKPISIIATSLIVLACTAGGCWFWWLSTPQYAVSQTAAAIKNHDVGSFHNWVNVHSLSTEAVNDMLGDNLRDIGGSDLLGQIIGLSVFRVLRPMAVDALDRKIDNWVEFHGTSSSKSSASEPNSYGGGGPLPFGTNQSGPAQSNGGTDNGSSPGVNSSSNDDEDDDYSLQPRHRGILGALVALVKPPSLKQTLGEYGFTRKNFRGLGQVSTDGNLAHVGIKFFSPKLNRELELVLLLDHNTGHWQITSISNLPALLSLMAKTDSSGRLIRL